MNTGKINILSLKLYCNFLFVGSSFLSCPINSQLTSTFSFSYLLRQKNEGESITNFEGPKILSKDFCSDVGVCVCVCVCVCVFGGGGGAGEY